MATIEQLIAHPDYVFLSQKVIGDPHGNPSAVKDWTTLKTEIDGWVNLQKQTADLYFSGKPGGRHLGKYKAELDKLSQQIELARQFYDTQISRLDPTPVSLDPSNPSKLTEFPHKYSEYRDVVLGLMRQRSEVARAYNTMAHTRPAPKGKGKLLKTIGLIAALGGATFIGGKMAQSDSNSSDKGTGLAPQPAPMEHRMSGAQYSGGNTWGVDPEMASARRAVALKRLRAEGKWADASSAQADRDIASSRRWEADDNARKDLNDPLERGAEAVETGGRIIKGLSEGARAGQDAIREIHNLGSVLSHGGN